MSQETEEARALVRFIETPEGEWPEWVREAWKGPLFEGYSSLRFSDEQQCWVIDIPQLEALVILEEYRPDAARYWNALGFPQEDGHFTFKEDEFEVVEGKIERQQVSPADHLDPHFRPHR